MISRLALEAELSRTTTQVEPLNYRIGENSSVRILIDYRPALRHRTGVGLWIHNLVEALAACSRSYDLAITVFSSSWKDRLSVALPADVTGIDRRVPVRLLNWLWHHKEWPKVESLTSSYFDVVHSPSPLLIPTRRAARLITIHDIDFLAHPHHGSREIRSDYPSLARLHAHRADGVIVPSAYTGDQVARTLQIPRDRITVCPNGAPSWSARARPPENGHIMFVGTIAPRKNIDRLLTAYAALREQSEGIPPLLLVGQATPEAASTLARLSSAPLAGHVHVLGYVDDNELLTLYRKAILVVLPSLDEGFGVPALEAMSLGVPLVAARKGALPEVVGNAGFLVDPMDTKAITAALKSVLTDTSLRNRLITAGLARAPLFSWRNSATSLIQAYLQAIERTKTTKVH